MSCSKWAYDPELCDGAPCPGDCDSCGRWEDAIEPDDSQLEMGFDPYAGCYTYDC